MKLSKINLEILGLVKEITDIELYSADKDFSTRGSDNYIVSNIKVSDWLEDTDVVNELNKLELHDHKDIILEEFTDERLRGIEEHTREWEIDYQKEKLEDLVHLENYFERARAYNLVKFLKITDTQLLPKELKFYAEHYSNEFNEFHKRKHNSYKDYLKYLKNKDKRGFEELSNLLNIEREVWQFGRSGGWLSICKASELEDSEFDYDLTMLNDETTNLEFNNTLNYELDAHYTYKAKRSLINELKEFIKDWQDKKESIEYINDLIQEDLGYYKDALIDRLNTEIQEFVEDLDISVSNVKVSISGDKVKTTLGISVDKDEFEIKFNNIAPHLIGLEVGEMYKINKRVGNYLVEFAIAVKDDVLIKAGCHKFSFNNLKEVFNY